jgi:hypothetical protein
LKTSKLLARAALPAGAALLSLSAWAVAASSLPDVVATPAEATLQLEPSTSVAPAEVVADDEPLLAPQVGNMKYSCRVAPTPVVASVTTAVTTEVTTTPAVTPAAAERRRCR